MRTCSGVRRIVTVVHEKRKTAYYVLTAAVYRQARRSFSFLVFFYLQPLLKAHPSVHSLRANLCQPNAVFAEQLRNAFSRILLTAPKVGRCDEYRYPLGFFENSPCGIAYDESRAVDLIVYISLSARINRHKHRRKHIKPVVDSAISYGGSAGGWERLYMDIRVELRKILPRKSSPFAAEPRAAKLRRQALELIEIIGI